MVFTPEDSDMMEYSLKSLKAANEGLKSLTLEEAIMDVSHFEVFSRKKEADTKMLDAIPEYHIITKNKFKDAYGNYGVVLGEESGKGCEVNINPLTPIILSDPLDGSTNLSNWAKDEIRENAKYGIRERKIRDLGELFDYYNDKQGNLSNVKAPVSAVTLVKDGKLKYSIVLNLLTGRLYAAYHGGVFEGDIRYSRNVDHIDKPIVWRDDAKPLLLCNRKGDKRKKNLAATRLGELFEHDFSAEYYAGPSRFFYLLDKNKGLFPNLGVIGHNREGIQEIISNICFALYSGGALNAYKLACPEYEKPFFTGRIGTKEGRLNEHVFQDIQYPSDYEDTTVITPTSNTVAVSKLEDAVKEGYAMRLV